MSGALDRFFDHYYRARPVNATFTGVHDYDDALPDWSVEGLTAFAADARRSNADLLDAHPASALIHGKDGSSLDALDADLARRYLEIAVAENEGSHGVRANPSLWTGEAVFSVISLMIRPFAPLDQRLIAAAARLDAIPAFLGHARATIGEGAIPEPWAARALRECEGAQVLLERGVEPWLLSAPHDGANAARVRAGATRAAGAFGTFTGWLRERPAAGSDALACGPEFFDLLLARGHHCARSRAALLFDARSRLAGARATLDAMALDAMALDAMALDAGGAWEAAQERIAADHPQADDFFPAFDRTWRACRALAAERDVVTWPDWPIRYVPYPEWTREAAPYLYYLHYRSPAPSDAAAMHEYVVPPLDERDPEPQLRAWNHAAITLNHVVHHGAIGHHVQNWHAYHRARSRIGKVAAVDCASRIGMFCAGTMAEGWACYATELMEELGFLSPLERLSQQHTRVRLLARAIADIELHQRSMTFDDAVRFYVDTLAMPEAAARAEATKNSMFPCTGLMYWLGTQGILDLREALRRRRGAAFSLKAFHDELLGHGSIPVPLIARLMLAEAA